MGLFSSLFSSSGDDADVKVRQSNEDASKVRGDKYEHTENGEHVHRGYDLNTSTGDYREYIGGEKSSDRSYNKSSSQ
jgi:hypothetical protein